MELGWDSELGSESGLGSGVELLTGGFETLNLFQSLVWYAITSRLSHYQF